MFFSKANLVFHLIFLTSIVEAARSIGCKAQAMVEANGVYNRTILSNGIWRNFTLTVPPNYHQDNATGHPLIFFYHGWGSSGTEEISRTNWTSPLVNQDAVVVFMDGLDQAWQGAPYAAPGVNDIQFTRDVIHRMRSNLCVDTSRMYAVGFSNGGGFVNTMACDPAASNFFAGFTSSSGAFYNNSVPNNVCKPARKPIPYLEIHGKIDIVVPYDGGYSFTGTNGSISATAVPPIQNWTMAWAARNGCKRTTMPANLGIVNSTEEYYDWPTWAVRHYAITDQGHGWQGWYTSDPVTGAYKDEVSLITDFLYKYTFVSKA